MKTFTYLEDTHTHIYTYTYKTPYLLLFGDFFNVFSEFLTDNLIFPLVLNSIYLAAIDEYPKYNRSNLEKVIYFPCY